MIGYFGNIIFETSDQKILNFSDLTHDVSANYGYHEIIGGKPKSEFQNPSLETLSFTINLNGNYGVNPQDEIDLWNSMVRSGKAYTLVLGGKVLGTDLWVCKTVSSTWGVIYQDGTLYSAEMSVSLEEYIST